MQNSRQGRTLLMVPMPALARPVDESPLSSAGQGASHRTDSVLDDQYESKAQFFRTGVFHDDYAASFCLDDDGIFLLIASSAAQVLGYSPEHLRGRHFSMLLPKRIQRLATPSYERLMKASFLRNDALRNIRICGMHQQGYPLVVQVTGRTVDIAGARLFVGDLSAHPYSTMTSTDGNGSSWRI